MHFKMLELTWKSAVHPLSVRDVEHKTSGSSCFTDNAIGKKNILRILCQQLMLFYITKNNYDEYETSRSVTQYLLMTPDKSHAGLYL